MQDLSWFTRIKLFFKKIFSEQDYEVKIPRKKLEMQLNDAKSNLKDQIEQLSNFIQILDEHSIVYKLGIEILQPAKEFIGSELIGNNIQRLQNLSHPLVNPWDISVWVLHRMENMGSKINYFLQTSR